MEKSGKFRFFPKVDDWIKKSWNFLSQLLCEVCDNILLELKQHDIAQTKEEALSLF